MSALSTAAAALLLTTSLATPLRAEVRPPLSVLSQGEGTLPPRVAAALRDGLRQAVRRAGLSVAMVSAEDTRRWCLQVPMEQCLAVARKATGSVGAALVRTQGRRALVWVLGTRLVGPAELPMRGPARRVAHAVGEAVARLLADGELVVGGPRSEVADSPVGAAGDLDELEEWEASGDDGPPDATESAQANATPASAPSPNGESSGDVEPTGTPGALKGPESVLAAPKRRSVLLLPLAAEGLDEVLRRQVEEAAMEALAELPALRVVSQAEVSLLLEQAHSEELAGCEEAAATCMARLSDAASVDLAISGRLGKVADSFIVSLSLADTRSAAAVARASEVAYEPEGVVEAGRAAVRTLFGEGESAGPRFRLADSTIRQVALLNLASSGVEANVAENLTQVIAVRLKQVEGLSVLTWDDVKSMLTMERMKDLLSCQDDVSCMAEVGGAMGAEALISGHVGKLGDTYVIGLKLIDPREVKVLNRVTESFRGDVNQLIRAARFAIGETLGLERQGEGTLEIAADVGEGKVFLEDQTLDLAGFDRRLAEGKYLLRIEAEDYLPWSSDVYVERDDVTRLSAALEERPLAWYQEWWVWTLAGAVVVGTGAAVGIEVLTSNKTGADLDTQEDAALPRGTR